MNLTRHKILGYLLNPSTTLFILSISFYLSCSAIILSQKVPFFDEVNAWNISQNCSFTELFQITRHEGHFMLWFLLLKPFSLTNFYFPYSMLALNWFFAFSAILLLWWKAPFNPWLKTFITFSLPLQMFTIYARCYAVGTLILFTICILYPRRKDYPVLYPFLIILLGNTSVIACVGAFVFGLLYCYEAFKDLRAKKINLKDLLKPFVVFSLGGILILSQMVSFKIPYYSVGFSNLFEAFFDIFRFIDYWPKNLVIILQLVMLLTGLVFFKKDRKPYFFLVVSTLMIITIALTVYRLRLWHYMFLFLYLVCAIWLYLQKNKPENIVQKTYYGMFFVLSFLWIFYSKFPWWWDGFYVPTTKYLKEHMDEYKGAKIFMYPADPSNIGVVPMLRDYDINFYSSHGFPFTSYKSYLYQWDTIRIDFINIRKEILSDPEKSDKAYMFVSISEEYRNNQESFLKLYELNSHGVKIELKEKIDDDIIIYKLSVDKRKTPHRNPQSRHRIKLF